jgi:hypothetical protein
LKLNWNYLTGTIPSELGLLTNAAAINLIGNALVGVVPQEVCDLIANNGTKVHVDCKATNCTCGCECFTLIW